MTNFKEEIEHGLGSFHEEASRVKQRVMQKEKNQTSRKRQWLPAFISIVALVMFAVLVGTGQKEKQADDFSFDQEEFEMLVVLEHYFSPYLTTKEMARYDAFNSLMREKAQIYVASQKVTMSEQEIQKLQKQITLQFETELSTGDMKERQERIGKMTGMTRAELMESVSEGEAYRQAYKKEFGHELDPLDALEIYEKEFSSEISTLKEKLNVTEPKKLGNSLDLALSFSPSEGLAVTKQEGEIVYTDPVSAGYSLLEIFRSDLADLQQKYNLPAIGLSSYQDYIGATAESIANGQTELQGLWEALVIYWNTFKNEYPAQNINLLQAVSSDKSIVERNGMEVLRGETVIKSPTPLDDTSLVVKNPNNPAGPIDLHPIEQLASDGLYMYRVIFEVTPHSSDKAMLQKMVEGQYTISIEEYTLHF